jgi:hypothetical protein
MYFSYPSGILLKMSCGIFRSDEQQVKVNMMKEIYFLSDGRLCFMLEAPFTLFTLWNGSATSGTGGPPAYGQ